MSKFDDAEYKPSTWDWVREQVATYEASGGTEANTLMDTGIPIIVFHTIGHKSGALRKVPLMRVEKDGAYAIIGSKGGDPKDPAWVANVNADPEIRLQDGATAQPFVLRLIDGDERTEWWDRAVGVYPPYAEYQEATDRKIPVYLAEPR